MKFKKVIKVTLITFGVFIVLFLSAAVAIPILFKDKILFELKSVLDENMDAKTEFKDIHDSLFRHFPNVSVRLNDIYIIGKDTFKNDTLISAKQIDLVLNLRKVLKGNFDILKIDLIKPNIQAIVNADGKQNWNIFMQKNQKKADRQNKNHFSINLRHYSIDNGNIELKDFFKKTTFTIKGLNHKGSGKFNCDNYILSTETNIKELSYSLGKITYINKVKATIKFDIGVESKINKFSFDTKDIKINGLELSAKGSIQVKDTSHTFVNFEFKTASNDFKDIISIIPGVYKDNFKNIITTGNATISGNMKGIFSKYEVPSFKINLLIDKASFKYPDLPQKIENIQISLSAINTDGIPDNTILNLEKGHIEFGAEPLDFSLLLKKPLTIQYLEAYAKGYLDFAHLGKFIKLNDDIKLSGYLYANLSVKGALLQVENKIYDSINAKGTLTVSDFNFSSKDYPETVLLNSLALTFNPDTIALTNLHAQFLNTQFTGYGYINNLLGYYLHNSILNGTININADSIDANKWKNYFTKAIHNEKKQTDAKQTPTAPFVAPAKLNISFNTEVREIEYDRVKIKAVKGLMTLGDKMITIQNVEAHALEGNVKINGYYSSVIDEANPDLNFVYIISLGKLMVIRRHITHL